MVKVEWAITPFEEEFERWYRQAGYRERFLSGCSEKYLPVQQGEILVRVSNDKFLSAYELLSWRIAKYLSIS
ncbi:hypothetical protein CEN47_27160 [Fischerella thermalis CCMEE 5319]|nr:hypothetical protein CEN47_27160 [Fischerella thermalis CCMEE 5319]